MSTTAIISAIVSATFLAAVITASIGATVTISIARKKSSEEERSRRRTVYAEAFQAVAAYKELPYAIRRRRHDEPERERIRLSEEARKVQERLSYYRAWTQAESKAVGDAYAYLVTEVRRVAGGACNQAWTDAPITSDASMNISTALINLSGITPLEDAYTAAAQKDLKR